MTDLMAVLHPATPPEPKGARLIKGYASTPDPDENLIHDEKRMKKLKRNREYKLRLKMREKMKQKSEKQRRLEARKKAMEILNHALNHGGKV